MRDKVHAITRVAALCALAGVLCSPAGGSTLLGSRPAEARAAKMVAAGDLVIAGRRMRCGDTPTMLRDFDGFAQSSNVIVLNMRRINTLPKVVRWLVYYHECGHIHMGASETAADCWAVKRARAEGWLSRGGLSQLCETFNAAGHSAAHPAPAERCALMRQCFKGSRRPVASGRPPGGMLLAPPE